MNVTNGLDQLLCPFLAADPGNKTILCHLFKLPLRLWELDKVALKVPLASIDNNTNEFRKARHPVQTMENPDIVDPIRIRDRTVIFDLIHQSSVDA